MKARDRILGLLSHAAHGITGNEIMQICGLWAGSFYVAVARMEREGLIESEWEKPDPSHDYYPRRRIYRLSGR
jgi:DNA-binding PadR family transcriptional regulator